MVLGWFGGRGGPGTPATVAARTGARLDGGHCGPRLNLGLMRLAPAHQPWPDRSGKRRETVLAGPCAGLDQDAFFERCRTASLDCGLSQARYAVECPLNTRCPKPSSLALSRQNMMICLARCAAELRSAHVFATRQLMDWPQMRKDVRILYRFCTRFPPFQQNSARKLTGLSASFCTKPCK